MPLTQEDLLFQLVLDVDTKSVKVVKDLGKQINLTYEAQVGIIDRITGKLSDQQGRLNEIKMALDPTLLKERAKLELEEEELSEKRTNELNKQKEILKMQKEIGSGISDIEIDLRSPALKEATAQLDAQKKQLEKIREMMNPDLLREQVRLEKELTTAQDEYVKAKQKVSDSIDPVDVVEPTMKERLGEAYKEGGVGGVLKEVGTAFKEAFSGLFGGSKPTPIAAPEAGVIPKAAEAGGGGGFDLKSIFGGLMSGSGGGMKGILAAAGPEGALIAAIPMLVKGLGKLAAAPFALVSKGLSSVSGGLHELQGPLGPIGAMLSGMSAAIEGVGSVIKSIPVVGEVLGPMIDAMAAIPKLIADITNSLVSMAAKASPAQFKIWQLALDDVQGVIGRSFVPVLRLMTEAVRFFGDILATILPSMEEVNAALAPMRSAWNDIKESLKDVVAVIGPYIKETLLSAITVLGVALKGLAANFRILMFPISALLKFLGINTDLKSSQGASARQAKIGGLEEYEKGLQVSAYGAGYGEDKQTQQVNLLGEIRNILGDINNFFINLPGQIIDGMATIWNQILNAIQNLPSMLGEVISGFITGKVSGAASAVGSGVGAALDPFGVGRAVAAAVGIG